MDQTPPFHPSLDLDYFAPLHFPNSMTLSDALDHPRRKFSAVNFESPSLRYRLMMQGDTTDTSYIDNVPFHLHPKDEEPQNDHTAPNRNESLLRNWQAPTFHNFLDVGIESCFGIKDNMDPFQICRSRGGSFNFGRFRKDSEDLFNMNSDSFRHMRNIADIRNSLENTLLKNLPQQNFQNNSHSPNIAMDIPKSIMDNSFMLPPSTAQNNMINAFGSLREIAGNVQDNMNAGIIATARNTDSTVDTVESSEEQAAKKRGRKKRMLNDKTGANVEKEVVSKPPVKLGRPKKIKDDNGVKIESQTLQLKAKASKSAQDPKFVVKSESYGDYGFNRDNKFTEGSNNSKVENGSNLFNPKNNIMNDIMKIKTSDDVKDFLGGLNVPEDVKEFLKKSPMMNQVPWLETKKIGTLTLVERRVKIEKYLEKRKKRTWSRRINYDCRKRVADGRLRIKGRFVTRDQAFTLLDEANIAFDPETITNAEIKTLLTEKFGATAPKRKTLNAQNSMILLKRPSEKELEGEDEEDFGSDLSE